MSVFTAKMIKEARINANLSQEEAAKALGITDRTLRSFENNQHPVSVDDLLNMAKLYKTDVREFILENYVEEKEEQILCNRYGSFLKLFDQLSDRDKEDVVWVIKQRINGTIQIYANSIYQNVIE